MCVCSVPFCSGHLSCNCFESHMFLFCRIDYGWIWINNVNNNNDLLRDCDHAGEDWPPSQCWPGPPGRRWWAWPPPPPRAPQWWSWARRCTPGYLSTRGKYSSSIKIKAIFPQNGQINSNVTGVFLYLKILKFLAIKKLKMAKIMAKNTPKCSHYIYRAYKAIIQSNCAKKFLKNIEPACDHPDHEHWHYGPQDLGPVPAKWHLLTLGPRRHPDSEQGDHEGGEIWNMTNYLPVEESRWALRN